MYCQHGIGGRVTDVQVRVRAAQLDNGVPVAVRDTLRVYDLMIDFGNPPEVIATALAHLFQEAVDSGRWRLHRTSVPEPGTQTPPDSGS